MVLKIFKMIATIIFVFRRGAVPDPAAEGELAALPHQTGKTPVTPAKTEVEGVDFLAAGFKV